MAKCAGLWIKRSEFKPPGGLLRLVNDGDDQRIFLGLIFSILGFFWARRFGKYFLG